MSLTELQIRNRQNNADIVYSLAVLAVYELTYSFFLDAILNFGVVSLFAPLIQRGARADTIITEQDQRWAKIREQRYISDFLDDFLG